jgi:hypothetical protein
MSRIRLSFRGLLVIATAALLAACAQHGDPMLPSTSIATQALAMPDAKVPKCKGQKTTKEYASLTVTLSTEGGSFCIPRFGGFGGTVNYPSANPSVQLQLISSTSDYDNLPQLGSGSAIFYLQLAISGATQFGANTSAGGGLTSKDIVPGDAYTAFGEAIVYGFKYHFTPCYTIATKGTYGGVIGGLGTLLKDVDIPAKASGFVEIYSGEQSSSEC